MEFAGAATPLGSTDIADVAAEIGGDAAAVHAVCDIESAGRGFLLPPDPRPVILFESHPFHTATRGAFDGSHPGISTSSWVRNYGPGGAHQYDRLAEAITLNRAAALASASWGRFQILASNHAMCGFADVEAFVAAMVQSEKAHLDAFAGFCKASGALARLRAHDWAGFAEIYNGPGYADNGYDWKLAAAWRKWNATPTAVPGNSAPRTAPELFHGTLQLGSSGDAVTRLQTKLGIGIDGKFGYSTLGAVEAFQKSHHLGIDGIVGPMTAAVIGL